MYNRKQTYTLNRINYMTICVFDIDGTMANIDHRLGFVRSQPKNWPAFERAIPHDSVNEAVASVYKRFVADPSVTVVLASGRSETGRILTATWYTDNKLDGYNALYMRAAGDYRSDIIVKQEILDQIVIDFGHKPDMVFDDRPGVVDMWRSNGIWVFDCNQTRATF
jgi:hypothetical protein